MKPVEIPPGPFPSRPRRTFEIRCGDSVGAVIGTLQADTYLQAAGYASRQFFGGSGHVMRATGWGDAPGTFLDTAVGRPPVLFFIAEPGVTAQHPLGHFRNADDAGLGAAPALVGTNPHHVTGTLKHIPQPKPQPKRKRR